MCVYTKGLIRIGVVEFVGLDTRLIGDFRVYGVQDASSKSQSKSAAAGPKRHGINPRSLLAETRWSREISWASGGVLSWSQDWRARTARLARLEASKPD